MSAENDYCELCDLPRSTCIHGMPKPVAPPEPVKPARVPKVREPKPRKAAAAKSVSTRTTTAPRKWTQPGEFMPHIVAMLDEAGDGLDTEEALTRLGERMADSLRPGDHEKSPQGEFRWRTAARKARRELVSTGLLSDDQPGIWKLKG